MYDVAIIGGGVAGLTAAIYAVRNGHTAVIFERASVGGQITLTNEVENYPAISSISGFELAANMEKQAATLGAEIRYEEVASLELLGSVKKVVTAEGVYEARNVILAMGAEPKRLGLAGEERYIGRGISYCAVCDAAFYRGKIAAVIGGGNTAVQDAAHLARFAKKVYLIHRRTEFRAAKVETDKLKGMENIEILTSYVPVKILADGKITGLEIESRADGTKVTLEIAGIFLAIGYTPNTQLVKDAVTINENGYIVTDAHMRTGIPGVFAAGDLVEKPLRQLITAENDGAIAASSLELE